MSTLDLRDLARERPGLTSARGSGYAEAAAVCLEHNSHQPGVTMNVDGDGSASYAVTWDTCNAQTRRTWADLPEAAEHGSYGIATLLLEAMVGLTVVERSAKGPGFDYWLGTPDDVSGLFQNRARLEVSGIIANPSAVGARTSRKKRQTDRSSDLRLPAYVVVVEYSQPLSRVVKK